MFLSHLYSDKVLCSSTYIVSEGDYILSHHRLFQGLGIIFILMFLAMLDGVVHLGWPISAS